MIKPVPSTQVAQLIRDVSACNIAGAGRPYLGWGANFTKFLKLLEGHGPLAPPVDFFIGNLYLYHSLAYTYLLARAGTTQSFNAFVYCLYISHRYHQLLWLLYEFDISQLMK